MSRLFAQSKCTKKVEDIVCTRVVFEDTKINHGGYNGYVASKVVRVVSLSIVNEIEVRANKGGMSKDRHRWK